MSSIYDELKGLNVFSKKANGDLNICVSNGAICIGGADGVINKTRFAWQDNGWSNTSDNWIDNGWANSGGWGNGRWVDNGWSNSSNGGRWQDSGWSNSSNGGHWTDQGWNNSGSGCYVTTACVDHVGLADDCEEKINDSETKDEELEYLYVNLVQKCVELLKEERYDEAKEHYVNVFHELLDKYNC